MKQWLKACYTTLCKQLLKHGHESEQLCYFYSFPHNNNGWLNRLIEAVDMPITILYTENVREDVMLLKKDYPHIELVCKQHLGSFFTQGIRAIKSSRYILCDNYEPVLASISSTTQKIGMLWHADGAIKQFGACDPKNSERSSKDIERLYHVYRAYTDFFVPSKAMGTIFEASYLATPDKLHNTGFVRSDRLTQLDVDTKRQSFEHKHPEYKDKTIVLYAPTYRESEEEVYPFDAEALEQRYPHCKVICHYHPHSKQTSTPLCESYETLLCACDILITDYSSIPFDYTLLHPYGRVILYHYDQEQYRRRYGLEPLFMARCPFDIVKTQEALLDSLTKDTQDYTAFNAFWNTYNDGKATERLIQWIGENK